MRRFLQSGYSSLPSRVFARFFKSDAKLHEIFGNVNSRSTNDQWMMASRRFVEEIRSRNNEGKASAFSLLASSWGVDHEALGTAINLYHKNPNVAATGVRIASTPRFHQLVQTIGNLEGGVQAVCEMRATLLDLLRDHSRGKANLSALRRLEESAREVLSNWFCLSNLQLQRLTFQSPADILEKVAKYEAVHPLGGLIDLQRRLGPHRRCFAFFHSAVPREPLVMVHVALTKQIAHSIQDIVKNDSLEDEDEGKDTTAIYYSISSTQKGLAGIDLGNLLIKRVAADLQKESPQLKAHSTLSPIPGFRNWMIRCLHGHAEMGNIVEDRVVALLSKVHHGTVSRKEAEEFLLRLVSNERTTIEDLNPFKEVLMHIAARYLCEAKAPNGFALNPVANFHLRNGAELYRLNWAGDVSVRGLKTSCGMMVNYRYRLDRVSDNAAAYALNKHVVSHTHVNALL